MINIVLSTDSDSSNEIYNNNDNNNNINNRNTIGNNNGISDIEYRNIRDNDNKSIVTNNIVDM